VHTRCVRPGGLLRRVHRHRQRCNVILSLRRTRGSGLDTRSDSSLTAFVAMRLRERSSARNAPEPHLLVPKIVLGNDLAAESAGGQGTQKAVRLAV
jgi:hypothetical protein